MYFDPGDDNNESAIIKLIMIESADFQNLYHKKLFYNPSNSFAAFTTIPEGENESASEESTKEPTKSSPDPPNDNEEIEFGDNSDE